MQATFLEKEKTGLLDGEVERSFLKKDNLSIALALHDVFNQNNGFLQEYSATALTQTYQKTLGRYAMLSLRYRFDSKKD